MRRVKVIFWFCFLPLGFASAQCISGDCNNGKGTYVFKSGARYVGEFANGKIHGVGTLYYVDGRRYTGEWSDSYQEGRGIMSYPDGRVTKGNWKKGHYVTEGAADAQVGCIVGNCTDGKGTFIYQDGSKYQGTFVNGKKEGFGQHWLASGEHYEGFWKDNEMHGSGVQYLVTGDSIVGVWDAGKYNGDIQNSKQVGCVNGNCYNGSGTYITSDGSRYVGEFEEGLFSGYGTCVYKNGDKYIGEWYKNMFHGEGVMYFDNGQIVNGVWEHGAIKRVIDTNKDNISNIVTNAPKFDPTIKVWAVITGVAQYNHMRTLSYTDDDAYRVAMFLKSPEGGALPEEQIAVLIDEQAKKNNILEAMQSIFSKADSNDMVLFYFSGHGLKGSFIPYDFDGFNNQISHESVKAIMEQSQAKFKVCIADACHSGSLNTFATRSVSSRQSIIDQYYEAFDAVESSTVLLLSSKAEEKSLESSGLRQGIFSHFLIRGLRGEADYDRDNIVKITELYRFVFLNVQAYTGDRQTPIIKGDYDGNMPMSVVK